MTASARISLFVNQDISPKKSCDSTGNVSFKDKEITKELQAILASQEPDEKGFVNLDVQLVVVPIQNPEPRKPKSYLRGEILDSFDDGLDAPSEEDFHFSVIREGEDEYGNPVYVGSAFFRKAKLDEFFTKVAEAGYGQYGVKCPATGHNTRLDDGTLNILGVFTFPYKKKAEEVSAWV